MMEKEPMYGNLEYKQLSLRATLWEESGVKLLLRNFLTTFSITLEGNEFLLDVLVKVIYVKVKTSPSIIDFKYSVNQSAL